MMTKELEKRKQEIPEEIKKLVIARLDVIPKDKKISIGSEGEFTKKELIQRVGAGDEIGRKVVEMELKFLKALREGTLLDKTLAATSGS